MTTFLLVIILLGISAVAILIIYLIDRVNTLQRFTRLLQSDLPETGSEREGAGPFAGLSGRGLWGAVSGEATEGWDETSIELIRKRYQLILRRHVESLFQEGFRNGQAGIQAIPTSTFQVTTLRGTVESWIPLEHALALYKTGADRAKATDDKLPQIRKSLDDASEILFAAAKLKLSQPMSEHLIPLTETETLAKEAGDAKDLGLAATAKSGSGPSASSVPPPALTLSAGPEAVNGDLLAPKAATTAQPEAVTPAPESAPGAPAQGATPPKQPSAGREKNRAARA